MFFLADSKWINKSETKTLLSHNDSKGFHKNV